jgi:hypothetical protein
MSYALPLQTSNLAHALPLGCGERDVLRLMKEAYHFCAGRASPKVLMLLSRRPSILITVGACCHTVKTLFSLQEVKHG